MDVRVQAAPFDIGAETSMFHARQSGAGAIVTFTGVTRDVDGGLDAMEIEHYPAMTLPAMEQFVTDAITRFKLLDALVIHRHGRMEPGDVIMMVATAATHRVAAFEAAEYLMDYLKSRAPFWKKEVTRRGAEWVEAKPEDEDLLSRWD